VQLTEPGRRLFETTLPGTLVAGGSGLGAA